MDPFNGVETDQPPPVRNLRSRFEQLALSASSNIRPRPNNGNNSDLLQLTPPLSPRPRATSNSSPSPTPFDISMLRSSSSSSDLKSGIERTPPPPPLRTSKVTPNSSSPSETPTQLRRPVPTPPKVLSSPRPRSPQPSQALTTQSLFTSSLGRKVPTPPPLSLRPNTSSGYPSDTTRKPPTVPPRQHPRSDTSSSSSSLRPSLSQGSDRAVDTTVPRTISPFSEDGDGEAKPVIPPAHPSRRQPKFGHNHQPSSESSMGSSESDPSAPSKPSRTPFRPRPDIPTAASPLSSPVPPALPKRPALSADAASTSLASASARSTSQPNLVIPSHVAFADQQTQSPTSATMERKALGSGRYQPPPMRSVEAGTIPPRRPTTPDYSDEEVDDEAVVPTMPDSSRTSRRPPVLSFHYANVEPNVHVSMHAVVSVAGTTAVVAKEHHINIYDLAVSDIPVRRLDMKRLVSKDYKVTAMEFRPCAQKVDRGFLLWLGTKEGHLFELDTRTGTILATKYSAHPHPLLHIFRHGRSMVTLDESGKCLIWAPNTGGEDITLVSTVPRIVRVGDHLSFAKIIAGRLWTAIRNDMQHIPDTPLKVPVLRVYDIFKPGNPSRAVLPSEHVGAVKGATLVPALPGLVYVGHEAGVVSLWSLDSEDGYPKCVEVLKITSSDIISLEGVNDKLWMGGRAGHMSVFDVSHKPWVMTNAWLGHPAVPVRSISVDHYGIDKIGRMCVVSVGKEEQLRLWDGLLGLDRIDEEMFKYEQSFTITRPLNVLVISWNCDAARPESLVDHPVNANFLTDALQSTESPDIVAFGFQEVVDLESRSVAAKNLLATKDRNDDGLSENVTRAYRRWYDRLIIAMRQAMPADVTYSVVMKQSLVGLFSCIFVKDRERERGTIRDISINHIKRGMGGIYGNKGAIVSRFVLDDSSICLVNCHLAAGQNAVRSRNADVAAILEGVDIFPGTHFPLAYVGGGDGTMILDHEIVIVNGDMNYRIDHRRDAIIASVRTNEYSHLLLHDQLLREIKHNRGCRFRGFSEGPLTFPPTYKYDRGTDDYDTSEKRRLPAWCDRVLWRSKVPSRVSQLHYRRYEVDVSDHRPISAAFTVTVKSLKHEARQKVKSAVQAEWADEQDRLLLEAKKFYVMQALI